MRQQNAKATVPQDVMPNDAPQDSGAEVAFGAMFQIPVAGREGEKCRPLDHT